MPAEVARGGHGLPRECEGTVTVGGDSQGRRLQLPEVPRRVRYHAHGALVPAVFGGGEGIGDVIGHAFGIYKLPYMATCGFESADKAGVVAAGGSEGHIIAKSVSAECTGGSGGRRLLHADCR